MPILKSGRAVGIHLKNFVDEITYDESGELDSITFGYRPSVQTTRDLLHILPIYYYDIVNDAPNLASPQKSGFTFGEVIAGVGGWSNDELKEFVAWTNLNQELAAWLEINLIAIKEQEEGDSTSA